MTNYRVSTALAILIVAVLVAGAATTLPEIGRETTHVVSLGLVLTVIAVVAIAGSRLARTRHTRYW